MWITSSLTTVQTPTLIALGNFDGIHRGHQQVIQPILSAAPIAPGIGSFCLENLSQIPLISASQQDLLNQGLWVHTPANPQLRPSDRDRPYITVVTFHPHPQEFFSGQQRALLTPLNEKVHYLKSIGVEQLILLPFNRTLAALTPQEFVEDLLIQQIQPQLISVGQDFCFGRMRSGTTADLEAIASPQGITVQVTPLHLCQGERISSSSIRQALLEGDLSRAHRLLGRPYTLVGKVIQGEQLGRTIGFPTANLQLAAEKFLPRQGVYSVWVYCATPDQKPLPGVMNIGNRPTVNGMTQTIEVHVLDWSGDLYGQTLVVSLEKFLRPEQKFASLDALKTQIAADCETARSLLATSTPR